MQILNSCPHCGSTTEFFTTSLGQKQAVFAQCSGCKIQTQPLAESIDYAARSRIALVWNNTAAAEQNQADATQNDGEGENLNT